MEGEGGFDYTIMTDCWKELTPCERFRPSGFGCRGPFLSKIITLIELTVVIVVRTNTDKIMGKIAAAIMLI